ncbi:MAG: methyltransferase [Nanoarchaeota archaeon]|nr:methyltransferase [Nanoarchaeota archaeon]
MVVPKLVQDFIEKIKQDALNGTYSLDINGIQIDVFPYIFPPETDISKSSRTIYNVINNLSGEKVLDIGTGSGILAIKAAISRARSVDAVDILSEAVECARHNVKINNTNRKIRVFQSDLFCCVEDEYDVILANLPILDEVEEDLRFHSLIDPGFRYHQRFFNCAGDYLNPEGVILMAHANLEKDGFKKLEDLAASCRFKFQVQNSRHFNGYEWRNYKFTK